MKSTDFLDILLDLSTGKTSPYRKPNHTPSYVHRNSSHPPHILKQIPLMVQGRLSCLSSSENEFKNVSPPYNDALRAAGYSESIQFSKPAQGHGTSRRRRRRKKIYFTPPFNLAVQSNVSRMFYTIIDKCFPKNHPYLGKLFNRNTMKLSYSTTRNVDAIISSHNKKLLSTAKLAPPVPSQAVVPGLPNNPLHPPLPLPKRSCNCQGGPANCPLEGNCLTENIVYRADVSTDSPADSRFYLGLTSQNFKSRYASHKSSFTHERYSNSTTLSAYIWKLKAEGKEFTTRWSIASYAKPYHPLARRCHLCIKEKTLIARNIDDPKCLNLRSELLGKCRHKR